MNEKMKNSNVLQELSSKKNVITPQEVAKVEDEENKSVFDKFYDNVVEPSNQFNSSLFYNTGKPFAKAIYKTGKVVSNAVQGEEHPFQKAQEQTDTVFNNFEKAVGYDTTNKSEQVQKANSAGEIVGNTVGYIGGATALGGGPLGYGAMSGITAFGNTNDVGDIAFEAGTGAMFGAISSATNNAVIKGIEKAFPVTNPLTGNAVKTGALALKNAIAGGAGTYTATATTGELRNTYNKLRGREVTKEDWIKPVWSTDTAVSTLVGAGLGAYSGTKTDLKVRTKYEQDVNTLVKELEVYANKFNEAIQNGDQQSALDIVRTSRNKLVQFSMNDYGGRTVDSNMMNEVANKWKTYLENTTEYYNFVYNDMNANVNGQGKLGNSTLENLRNKYNTNVATPNSQTLREKYNMPTKLSIDTAMQNDYTKINLGETKNVSTSKLMELYTGGGERTTEQINSLREDIKNNGITEPIEISQKSDGTYTIENGNHRLQIANELGINEVPVKMVESWDSFVSRLQNKEARTEYGVNTIAERANTSNEESRSSGGLLRDSNKSSESGRGTTTDVGISTSKSNSNEQTSGNENQRINREKDIVENSNKSSFSNNFVKDDFIEKEFNNQETVLSDFTKREIIETVVDDIENYVQNKGKITNAELNKYIEHLDDNAYPNAELESYYREDVETEDFNAWKEAKKIYKNTIKSALKELGYEYDNGKNAFVKHDVDIMEESDYNMYTTNQKANNNVQNELRLETVLENGYNQVGGVENVRQIEHGFTEMVERERANIETTERILKKQPQIMEKELTQQQKKTKNIAKEKYNINVVYYDGKDVDIKGLTTNKNEIYIDKETATIYGGDFVLGHEIAEDMLSNHTDIVINGYNKMVEKIKNSKGFTNLFQDYTEGMTSKQKQRLTLNLDKVAKEILCDINAGKNGTNTELARTVTNTIKNNLEPQLYNDIVEMFSKYEKQIYGAENSNKSSFSLPKTENVSLTSNADILKSKKNSTNQPDYIVGLLSNREFVKSRIKDRLEVTFEQLIKNEIIGNSVKSIINSESDRIELLIKLNAMNEEKIDDIINEMSNMFLIEEKGNEQTLKETAIKKIGTRKWNEIIDDTTDVLNKIKDNFNKAVNEETIESAKKDVIKLLKELNKSQKLNVDIEAFMNGYANEYEQKMYSDLLDEFIYYSRPLEEIEAYNYAGIKKTNYLIEKRRWDLQHSGKITSNEYKNGATWSDMRKVIEKHLNKSLKLKGFRQRAYGIYKPSTDEIRIKNISDIETATHELGHRFDFKEIKRLSSDEMNSELEDLCTRAFQDTYKDDPDTTLREGWAEFVRRFIANNEVTINEYPYTTSFFRDAIEHDKKLRDTVVTLTNMVEQHVRTSTNSVISNMISVGEQTDKTVVTGIRNKIINWADQIMTDWFDDKWLARKLTKLIAKSEGKNIFTMDPEKKYL